MRQEFAKSRPDLASSQLSHRKGDSRCNSNKAPAYSRLKAKRSVTSIAWSSILKPKVEEHAIVRLCFEVIQGDYVGHFGIPRILSLIWFIVSGVRPFALTIFATASAVFLTFAWTSAVYCSRCVD